MSGQSPCVGTHPGCPQMKNLDGRKALGLGLARVIEDPSHCMLEASLISVSWTEEIVCYMSEMTDSMSSSILALPSYMTLVLSLIMNPTRE